MSQHQSDINIMCGANNATDNKDFGMSPCSGLDIDEVIYESEKAFMVRLEDEEYWIPKSVICTKEMMKVGIKNIAVLVEEWWIKKEIPE